MIQVVSTVNSYARGAVSIFFQILKRAQSSKTAISEIQKKGKTHAPINDDDSVVAIIKELGKQESLFLE